MRCLIFFVMLELILSGTQGAQSDDIQSDRKPARCKNPSGKPGQTLVKSCTNKDVCTLGKNNKPKWQMCPIGASQDTLKAFEADMKAFEADMKASAADMRADKADVDSKLSDMEVSLKYLFKQHLEIISLLHGIIGPDYTVLPSTMVTSSGPVWRKVYALNTAGGLFANLDETKKKNVDDPEADLFSILYDLGSMKNKDGLFHFKLCYPELTQFEFPSNEWKQSSNPVTESTITGFDAITLTFKNSRVGTFQGLGLSPPSSSYNLIDSSPSIDNWWYSIGTLRFYESDTVPGPFAPGSNPEATPVKMVELSVLYTPGG